MNASKPTAPAYRLTVTIRPGQSSDPLTEELVTMRANGRAATQIGQPETNGWGTHYTFEVHGRDVAASAHARFCILAYPVCYEQI